MISDEELRTAIQQAAYPVSTRVNSPKNQGPELIQPI